MTALSLSPARLAERTPADRDCYLDFLRAAAITVVVLGHWLMAVVWSQDGELRTASLLSESAVARGLTWVVQVMPVFFLVGGVVNARSWRGAVARATPYRTWLRARAARLLRPTVPLVWLWAVLVPALVAGGLAEDLVRLGARGALAPLWFLAVYLIVVAAVPPLLALHDRFGLGLVVGLTVAAALVDAVGGRLAMVNFFFVWAVPTALGFCWADGLLEGRARWLLPLAGAILLVGAVALLGYAVSMVGVPDAPRSNNSPPTVALALLGFVQTGAVLALRAPLTRWLRRPRAWAAVVGLNLVAMTVYLWHLTVMVLLVAGAQALDLVPRTLPLTATWWATRPLWLALLVTLLVPVTALLGRVELSTPSAPRGYGGTATALAAIAAASAAIAAFVLLASASATPLLAAVVTAAAVVLGAFNNNNNNSRRGGAPTRTARSRSPLPR